MKSTPGLLHESPFNIGFVCKNHAPKPDALLVKQAKQKPESFIGRYVKKGFPGKKPNGDKTLEHMWVLIESWDGEKFVGKLSSDPVLDVGGIKDGSIVTVLPKEIEGID